MTASEAIQRAWGELAREDSPLPGIYERRILASSSRDVHVALDRPSGVRAIYLGGTRRSLQPWREVATRGFRVSLEPGAHGGSPRARIELASPGFAELFDRICADVVAAFVSGSTEEKCAAAAWTRLGHWQRFFEKTNGGRLSEQKQIGLYGELWVLRRTLATGMMPESGLNAWKGPDGAPQDFAFPGASIEVKTTVAPGNSRVSISNLAQLDDTGLPALYLCHLAVDRRENRGETLPDIVQNVGTICGDELRDVLEGRLLAAGYSAVHGSHYSEYGYTSRAGNFFEVREGFPRLVREDVMVGVTEAEYEVELAAAGSFLVEEETCMAAISGDAGGSD